MRSLPEKTLEHWVSQYLTYRFRTHLALWWPTSGADIIVDPAIMPVGKAIWLELKTSEPDPVNNGIHVVTIDVKQLVAYGQRNSPPDYYVFPRPNWHGTLGDPAAVPWLGAIPPTDLAFRRAQDKWFGNWTRVISGASLRKALRRNGATHQGKAILGQWDSRTWAWGPAFTPAPGAPHPEWDWPDFWASWEHCGTPDMPAALILPDDGGPEQATNADVERDALTARLRKVGQLTRESLKNSRSDETRAIESREKQFMPRKVYLPRYDEDGVLTGKYFLASRTVGTVTNLNRSPSNELEAGRRPVLTMLPAEDIR